MLQIGTLTLKSNGVGSSIMEAVEETRIVLHPKAIVRADVVSERMNQEPNLRQELLKSQDPHNLQGQLADRLLVDKRTTAYYRMHQEIAVNNKEDFTMTEATAFAVNSYTLAAMETRTTSRPLKTVKVFVMTLLAFAIWLRCMVDAPKTLQNGTSTPTAKNVRSSNLADVMEIKITSTTKDLVKMFAGTTPAHQKLSTSLPQDHEL